ncbi:solute carrier family 66 member 2 [Callorhinchus milii]|uniref:Solute carrier family 66 member 2 n=1 Tax=Callorhinchus milii TaxID=7868 RepID=A0A4W3ILC6_CALMI|nr:solute carrier family 66 member 2 [Callorhinchus milii]|eukprot:gi/632944322/ref/XP_007887446.1/ PREDICTED: PQ-loop repeat-containing protein 1-like [Callorhinchus milii]
MADSDSGSTLSNLVLLFIFSLFSWIASLLMVFGGAAPYIPQYRHIQRSGNPEGFSTYVCLMLLVANILRLFFWLGRHFELTLLWQSVVLIITMLALQHLCCSLETSTRVSTKKHFFTDFEPRYFWNWSRFVDYVQFCLFFSVFCLVITYLLIDSQLYVESLGFAAVLTEAMLGVPQLLQNFKNKSTAGMSVKMVLLWSLGDTFKTAYFIINDTPMQFWVCGIIQICTDIAIFLQVFIYGQGTPKKYF